MAGPLPRRAPTVGGVAMVVVLLAALGMVPLAGIATGAHASGSGDARGPALTPIPPAPALPRPAAGEGSVLSTIDLVDQRVLPGATQPATQDTPTSVIFDPNNGDLYVRGYVGDSVTVLDGATDAVVQEVGVPSSQNLYTTIPTIAVDTSDGFLYTSNSLEGNLSVIDGGTNAVTGSVTTGGEPNGLAYDPAHNHLYVALWSLPEVAVVDPSTNTSLGDIPVGSDPGPVLYDPASGEVFVANYGSGNVSVIDAETGKVTANIVTGAHPVSLALDTADDAVDVADSSTTPGQVTVIPAGDVGASYNLSVGLEPWALAYAAPTDQLFVANSGSGNVSIIDQSTGTTVANPETGSAPQAIAYDAAKELVYVFNAQSYNVTILNETTDTVVGSVGTDNSYGYGLAVDTATGDAVAVSEGSYTSPGSPPHAQANATVIDGLHSVASIPINVLPNSVTYDPANGELLAIDRGGNDSYEINPTTNAIVGTRSLGLLPSFGAVDPANGEVYVTQFNETFPYNGSVEALSSSLAPIANFSAGFSPTGIAFDSVNGCFYVPDDVTGNVTVLNATRNQVEATIPLVTGADLVSVGYDPHSDEVYVGDNSNGTVGVIDPATESYVKWVKVGLDPSSIVYDPANQTVFVANEGSGNVTVLTDATDTAVANVPLEYAEYLAYDAANNLVYNAMSFAGDVNTINATTYASGGALLYLGSTSYPHGIAYDPADQDVYVTSLNQGSVSVIGTPVGEYTVTFSESGLPATTGWSVTLNGTTLGSSTATIEFTVPNGFLPYVIDPVSGYTANVTNGTVHVNGASLTVFVGFSASGSSTPYPVSFDETGLPLAQEWSVTLAGTPMQSSTSTIVFEETNGSYSYTIGPVAGYAPNVTGGSVHVEDGPATVDVAFTIQTSGATFPVAFFETGLTPGTRWEVSVSTVAASIGTGPYRNFSLPNASYTFTVPSVSGYTVHPAAGEVNVTGSFVEVNITFTPSGPGSSSPSGSSSWLSAWWLWAAIAVVVVAAVLFFLLASRRRKKPEPVAGPPAPEEPAAGAHDLSARR